VSDINTAIAQVLEAKVAVVLFPEGTCWDGCTLLPFKPSLLEPAARTRCPLTAAGLAYFLRQGSVRDEICYWGSMTLGPHLLNVLKKPGIRAAVRFGAGERAELDRKALATHLHAEVLALRDGIGA
jgi:1-acyl-sn-glycerol-3-phosphate acyltransferase